MDKYRRLAESFIHAGRGFRHCVRNERNLRIHITAVFYVCALGLLADISIGEWAAVLLCFALVISLELVNTAIELICDRITKEQDERIGRIKDISAAAVLIGAFFAAALAFVVFVNERAVRSVLDGLYNRPAMVIVLALSVPVALVFIFYKRREQ